MKQQWIKLASYGIYPHQDGIQNFTFESAQTLTKNFNKEFFSSCFCFLRKKGAPIYIGHPDDKDWAADYKSDNHKKPDTSIYGYVTQLDPRPDALWILVSWKDAGANLINTSTYQFFSPRWTMLPQSDETFTPNQLLSIGLTNNPNIPSDPIPPIINEHQLISDLHKTLNIPQTSSPSETLVSVKKIATDAHKFHSEIPLLKDKNRKIQSDLDALLQLSSQQEQQIQQVLSDYKKQQSDFIQLALQQAISQGKISPHEKNHWQKSLESNLPDTLLALANSKPALKISPSSINLPHSNSYSSLISKANSLMSQSGSSFTSAWSSLKSQLL